MYFEEHKKNIDELATAKKAFLDATANAIAEIEKEVEELTVKKLEALGEENSSAYTDITARLAIAKAKHEKAIAKQIAFDRENNVFQLMDDATNAYSAELAKQATIAVKHAEGIRKALSNMQDMFSEYRLMRETATRNFNMTGYNFEDDYSIVSLERFINQHFGELEESYNPKYLLGILRFMG